MPQLALTVAYRGFGIDLDAAAAALAEARPAKWRLEIKTTDSGVTLLNDAYNTNPTSMNAAVDALIATVTTGRRIAVLGDMLELGVYSDDAHVALGRRVAETNIDVLIGVGPAAE